MDFLLQEGCNKVHGFSVFVWLLYYLNLVDGGYGAA